MDKMTVVWLVTAVVLAALVWGTLGLQRDREKKRRLAERLENTHQARYNRDYHQRLRDEARLNKSPLRDDDIRTHRSVTPESPYAPVWPDTTTYGGNSGWSGSSHDTSSDSGSSGGSDGGGGGGGGE